MRQDIAAIADRLIPKPKSVERIREKFITDDIINEVLLKFDQCKDQLQAFAPYLKGATVKDTCNNVWAFWRKQITYQADDASRGKQIVKSPAAVWEDKFCDCKSFSVAVSATLYCLGIKSVFRFVSFPGGIITIPTHVYNAATHNGQEIIIDCCLPKFDMQKPYAAKYDYLAPGLYSVTGIGKGSFFKKAFRAAVPVANLFKSKRRNRGELRLQNVQTEAELGLVIHEQRLELEQDFAVRVHGIGSTVDNCYQVELAAVNNAICEIGNPALREERTPVTIRPASNYIGKPLERGIAGKEKRQEKKKVTKAKNEVKKIEVAKKKNAAGKAVNKKDAGRLEKLNITVAKKKEGILKKIAKVITAPVKLVQKGIIQATLPKSAPAFLYLFITDQKVLSKAPAVVINKRNKAIQHADRVVNKIGMKRDHFMGILRNGIMQNMGDTPENIIAQWMREGGFSIGFLSAVLPVVKDAFGFLGPLLGGKAAELMADAPSPADWGTVSAELPKNVTNQESNNDSTTGNGTIPVRTENQNYSSGYNYGNTSFGTNNKTDYTAEEFGEGEFGKANHEGKELDDVVVVSPKIKHDDSDNSLMYVALAAVAVMALAGGKSSKRKAA